MMRGKLLVFGFLLLVLFLYVRMARARGTPQNERIGKIRERLWPVLVNELKKEGFKPGAPVFMRIFKEEKELEVWLRDDIGGRYRRFAVYRVATWGDFIL